MDFKNLTGEQESILRSILSTCKYFDFASKNRVSDGVYVEQGRQLGSLFVRLEQLEAAKAKQAA
jgi:hypothetical protein